jgi:hypothetical protein
MCSVQAKCAGTSLRALLYNHTLGTGTEVCIPSYSHSFLVLSREGCHYDDSEDSRKPALMAGHFTWQEYEWMLVNARRLVSRDGACQACWCLFHRLRSLGSTKSGNMHASSRPASPELLAVRVDVWSLLRHRQLVFADCTTQGRTRVVAVRD